MLAFFLIIQTNNLLINLLKNSSNENENLSGEDSEVGSPNMSHTRSPLNIPDINDEDDEFANPQNQHVNATVRIINNNNSDDSDLESNRRPANNEVYFILLTKDSLQ